MIIFFSQVFLTRQYKDEIARDGAQYWPKVILNAFVTKGNGFGFMVFPLARRHFELSSKP